MSEECPRAFIFFRSTCKEGGWRPARRVAGVQARRVVEVQARRVVGVQARRVVGVQARRVVGAPARRVVEVQAKQRGSEYLEDGAGC